MIQLLYETKKQLKENVGSELDYIETSMFGAEYKSTGTITGCNKKRSWFANGQIEYEKLKLSSKKIKINDKNQYFLFEGDVSSPKSLVNSNLLTLIFKNNLENIGINNVNFGSENNFSFRLEKKFQISNFKIESKIDLQKLTYKKKTKYLKTIIPNYNDSVELINHKIELFF